MAGLVVKPRARILHGHDWIFSSEVLKIFGDPKDGDVISLKDGRDRLIGSAIYNSKSQIVARRFSRQRQDLDLDFFKRRIAQAAEYRDRRDVDARLRRVVWSESDGLPGVIIDRYGDHFVLQTLTLAMDMRKDLIATAIVDLFKSAPLTVIERNDAPVRRAEGLELRSGVLEGPAPSGPAVIEIGRSRVRCRSLAGAKDRLLSRPKTKLWSRRTIRRRTPGPRLFCKPRRIRADLCARRRDRRCRSGGKFREHRSRKTKRGAKWIGGALDRAGRFSIFARSRESRSGIRSDRSRSAVVYENKKWIA